MNPATGEEIAECMEAETGYVGWFCDDGLLLLIRSRGELGALLKVSLGSTIRRCFLASSERDCEAEGETCLLRESWFWVCGLFGQGNDDEGVMLGMLLLVVAKCSGGISVESISVSLRLMPC